MYCYEFPLSQQKLDTAIPRITHALVSLALLERRPSTVIAMTVDEVGTIRLESAATAIAAGRYDYEEYPIDDLYLAAYAEIANDVLLRADDIRSGMPDLPFPPEAPLFLDTMELQHDSD